MRTVVTGAVITGTAGVPPAVVEATVIRCCINTIVSELVALGGLDARGPSINLKLTSQRTSKS